MTWVCLLEANIAGSTQAGAVKTLAVRCRQRQQVPGVGSTAALAGEEDGEVLIGVARNDRLFDAKLDVNGTDMLPTICLHQKTVL